MCCFLTHVVTTAVWLSSTVALARMPAQGAPGKLLPTREGTVGFIWALNFRGKSSVLPSMSSSALLKRNDYSNLLVHPDIEFAPPEDVRVRFAPSPTGCLHVGNLRTFIYNYLYARKHGGTLIFRVDDTDAIREVSGSLADTINDLKWLGFSWNEGPGGDFNNDHYYQSKRQDTYRSVADLLVQRNKAYRCFCTKEEVKLRNQEANCEDNALSYDKKCRTLTEEEVSENILKRKEYTIRFSNVDHEEDFILMRSNGLATYNFACAVDDHSYGITHVIRGVDHLENTLKQTRILEAIGTEVPKFIHCSLMINSDQQKMSKSSKENVTISKLREMGICKLPIVNYLAFLGTRYTDDSNCRELSSIAKIFELDMLSRVPICFDLAKLLWLNRHYIHGLSHDDFVAETSTFLDDAAKLQTWVPKEMLKTIIKETPSQLKSGVETMRGYVELVDSALSYKEPRFVGADCYDYGGFFLKEESQKFLETFVEWSMHLITASDIGQSLFELLKDMLRSEEFIAIEGKQHLGVVRYALTGMRNGPPMTLMIDLWQIAQEHGVEGFVTLRERILKLRNLDLQSNDPVAERLFFHEEKQKHTD